MWVYNDTYMGGYCTQHKVQYTIHSVENAETQIGLVPHVRIGEGQGKGCV